MIAAVILEEFTLKHNIVSHRIIYEDLELLKTAKKQKIIKEISTLTGKDVTAVKIRRIDYREKLAYLDISYRD
jgi:hypothetical protein